MKKISLVFNKLIAKSKLFIRVKNFKEFSYEENCLMCLDELIHRKNNTLKLYRRNIRQLPDDYPAMAVLKKRVYNLVDEVNQLSTIKETLWDILDADTGDFSGSS